MTGLLDHCLELLASVGQPRARRMFGGQGLYVDELFIALIAHDRLFLKADAQTAPRFEAAGSQPFEFDMREGRVTTSYWSAPEEAMDSPEGMRPWARLAIDAALRARQAKPPARRKPGAKTARPAKEAKEAKPAKPAKPVKPPAAPAAAGAGGSSRSASPPPPRRRRPAG